MSTIASAVKRATRVPSALWWIFAAALILVVAWQAPLRAEDSAWEKYGDCLHSAVHTYKACQEAADNFLERGWCMLRFIGDFYVCTGKLVYDITAEAI